MITNAQKAEIQHALDEQRAGGTLARLIEALDAVQSLPSEPYGTEELHWIANELLTEEDPSDA